MNDSVTTVFIGDNNNPAETPVLIYGPEKRDTIICTPRICELAICGGICIIVFVYHFFLL